MENDEMLLLIEMNVLIQKELVKKYDFGGKWGNKRKIKIGLR